MLGMGNDLAETRSPGNWDDEKSRVERMSSCESEEV